MTLAPTAEETARHIHERAQEMLQEQFARDYGYWSNFIAHDPRKNHKQDSALRLFDKREILYGGAAGGGKSDWLLMCALQYVDVPEYSALLLRRTYTDLSLPGALMDRAQDWLQKTPAKWQAQDKQWKFPSGAILAFGHLDNENDKYRYQSSEFQFIGFDELTQFEETQYLYLFSRLRRLAGQNIPLRMRAGSNPDGVGFDWVKKRFITDALITGALFVPARLDDNPFLDRAEYEASLEKIAQGDPVTYQRLREGSWEERKGTEIRREWFEFAPLPSGIEEQCRTFDTAWTVKKADKDDPDYFATIGGAMANGWLYLLDPYKARMPMPDVVDWIENRKRAFPKVRLGMAQAAGEQIGKQFLAKKGIPVDDLAAETTQLRDRLIPFISHASKGLVKLVGTKEQWEPFLEEATAFPLGKHDDLLAACAGLTQMHGLVIRVPVPRPPPAPIVNPWAMKLK